MPRIDFAVQSRPRDRDSWVALARRVESLGFTTLYAADHPGYGSSPFVSLSAAAAVTDTLRLGTYVSQAGVREPAHLVTDAVALNVLAPGRVTLGLGAGHTPVEWRQIGRERPSAADRAARLVEFAEITVRLLAGERVAYSGRHLSVRDAQIDGANGDVAILIGGGNPAILRAAARFADVVALSGLGRTLPDGHQHDTRWAREDLERQLAIVRTEAERHYRDPQLDVLVQFVQVTDDRTTALEELSAEHDVPVDHLANAPYVLVGTHEELAAQIRRQEAEFGITSYAVREAAIDDIAAVMNLLRAD